MRFLADAGVSPKTVDFLKQLGHEAVHVRTLGLTRAADAELVTRARTESSVVVTFDLDFGDERLTELESGADPRRRRAVSG